MANPIFVTRVAPNGIPAQNGYQTLIATSLAPNLAFWEKAVKPPKLDGGRHVDTTTMWNVNVKTKAPSSLIDVADISVTAAYDPTQLSRIMAILNKVRQGNTPGCICVTHPAIPGLTPLQQTFFGYIMAVDPTENKDGSQPDIKLDIVVTNWDPINFVESLPLYRGGTPTGFRPATPPTRI